MKAAIFTDGGARGNPGPAGIGIVIDASSERIRYGYGEYIGKTTNNQAEYKALLFALEKALTLGVSDAECYLDSQLVVRQLKREYRVRDAGLAPLFLKVWNAAARFRTISFHHIERAKNKAADALVNRAIDARGAIDETEHY